MRKTPIIAALAALALALPAAHAGPRFGRDDKGAEGPRDPAKAKAHREEMLRRVHTQFVLELGEILGLDTAGTIKLSDRLKKYDEQRTQLRLEMWESMRALRGLARGDGSGDAAALARKAAATRVRLAELDQRELDEVLQGLAGEKAAKVALFATEFPKRVERMARMARDGRGGPGGPGGHGGGRGAPDDD